MMRSFEKLIHHFFVVGVFAHIRLEGLHARAVFARFRFDLCRRVLRLVVVEHYVRASLREEFHRGGANSTRASSNQCRLSRQRNHVSPN